MQLKKGGDILEKQKILTDIGLATYDEEIKTYIKKQGIGLTEDDVNDLIDVKLAPITDTKNTTGSSNTSSKIYLVGATNQENNPVTYSHDTAYVGTDGCIYSNNTRVATEAITTSEPRNQVAGDYWMLAY